MTVQFKAITPDHTLLQELDNTIIKNPGETVYRLKCGIIAICKYGVWQFLKGQYQSVQK